MSYDREVRQKLAAISRIVYGSIEHEKNPPSVICFKKKSFQQVIYELKHPSDPRLTPLTDAQIEQDLYDLGIKRITCKRQKPGFH